jgi:DivIVA domain-containing protein
LVRVALDRQRIEKKDFPIGRRGYDPEAVDAHLRALADEFEEFKRSARQRSETLASTASDQVRAIVDAAESSAAEIQRQAEEEASELRSDATREAQTAREQATAQARDYVGKVSESTSTMLQRLDAVETELNGLIQSLRTGSGRINADLQLLGSNLEDVRESVSPRTTFEPESVSPRTTFEPETPAAEPTAAVAEPAEGPPAVEERIEVVEQEVVVVEAEPAPAADGVPADGSDDTEGARLIALNMALNGSTREETDRYLAENFELSDRSALLDEVYASLEG